MPVTDGHLQGALHAEPHGRSSQLLLTLREVQVHGTLLGSAPPNPALPNGAASCLETDDTGVGAPRRRPHRIVLPTQLCKNTEPSGTVALTG